MRTRYAQDMSMKLGNVELLGDGWFFSDSSLNGEDSFGWQLTPLVGNGMLLEDAGGESGQRQYTFCKDFADYGTAIATYESLHTALRTQGEGALVLSGSTGAGAAQTVEVIAHAAVQSMSYSVVLVGGVLPCRLIVNYTIVYTR